MSLIRFLGKFPIKQYEPEDTFDYPLNQELLKRTFYYGITNDTKPAIPSFILLINEYSIDSKNGRIYSTDPDCLFIQCLLAKKHKLLLPIDNKNIYDTKKISNAKILSVNTENLPMLILLSTTSNEKGKNNDRNYITRDELMNEVNNKYFTLKERQWSNILDSTISPTWKRQIDNKERDSNNTTDIIDQYTYERSKCYSILSLFENEYMNLFNDNHTYFKLKLDTLIHCISNGQQVSVKVYIQSNCPTLSKIELSAI